MRIVYMGTPDFAVAPLKALVDGGFNVVAVVTTPDKPAGRGLKVRESAVKRYAVETGLPVFQPVRLKSPEFLEALAALRPELGIVVAFRMLPEAVYAMPRLGTFNLHASLLPQYRGAAPINWAVINGEKETGVTTFMLNPRMDEGAVIGARRVAIEPEDNAGTLHDKLMATGAELVVESVELLADESFRAVPQVLPEDGILKPAPKIFRETCHIDFNASGTDIINLIRGLAPYPAAWAELEETGADGSVADRGSLKIFSAKFEKTAADGLPGTLRVDGGRMRVVCRDGHIVLESVQPAGKQHMAASAYVNGLKHTGGLRLV